jgi:hypothetical protein
MAWPQSLNVALKEWASVCAALEAGRQIILLRKGGILEAIGGFELEHPQFLLFPTYLHQKAQLLKPEWRDHVEQPTEEPAEIQLSLAALVSDIVKVDSRQQAAAIAAQHVWAEALIDMRFNYRPKNPLYLLLVRAYRLPRAATIVTTPEYAGCKSWVPLEQEIATSGATPILSDADYALQREAVMSQLIRRGEQIVND